MFLVSKPILSSLTIVVSASICQSGAVHAADNSTDEDTLPSVVVSATRTPTPAAQVASSITVITAKDIEHKQQRTLPDVLRDVPGINMVQTGGPGGIASLFTRGTNPNHTKVVIDGINASDPSAFDGSFDFSQLLASGIERVEVLRGPQSGLYGSDAIGGVINITTKKGKGPAQFTGSVEGGSFSTFNQTAGVRGGLERFNYALDATHYQTGGVQVTPSDLVPAGRRLNDDYYDNKTLSTKLGANLTDTFDVGFVGRVVDTALKFTSDDGIGPEDARSNSDNREYFTRGTGHLALFDGAFDQTAGIAYTQYHRTSKNPNPGAFAPFDKFEGDRIKADWQGDIKLMQEQLLTLGLEHQRDAVDTLPNAQIYNNAAFIQLQSSFGGRLFNSISFRRDEHELFGGKTTYRIAPAYLIKETDTKLKASFGTGFRAPSLDQLYHDYPGFGFFANPALQPETSTGYDIGFEQTLWKKQVQFGSTYFHNDIKNLIDFNPTFTSTINVGRTSTYGFETFIAYKPWEQFNLRGDHTFTIAQNDILDQALRRRPKHKASLNATWQATDKLSLSGSVLYTGSWVDINRSGSMSGLTPGGYALLNLTGSYDLGNGLAAFARIDNALNKEYQNPIGFQRPGIGVYGGLKCNFNAGELL